MIYPVPQTCPVCQGKLMIKELHCYDCHTSIKGNFQTTRLSSLNEEQLKFVEIFLKVRGNIKEMERELGISYPTVRNRLENIAESLGYKSEGVTPTTLQGEAQQVHTEHKSRKQFILQKLEKGEITPEQALKLLKE